MPAGKARALPWPTAGASYDLAPPSTRPQPPPTAFRTGTSVRRSVCWHWLPLPTRSIALELLECVRTPRRGAEARRSLGSLTSQEEPNMRLGWSKALTAGATLLALLATGTRAARAQGGQGTI